MTRDMIFDVMLGDRFICTLKFRFLPCFPIEQEELMKFVEKKRPTLKGKKYHIMIDKII